MDNLDAWETNKKGLHNTIMKFAHDNIMGGRLGVFIQKKTKKKTKKTRSESAASWHFKGEGRCDGELPRTPNKLFICSLSIPFTYKSK